jgi:hypothetical protein
VIVTIPIATGQTISDGVIESINNQSVLCGVVICSSYGEINSQDNYTEKRLKGEAESRNKCVYEMLKSTYEYGVMQDRDAEHLQKDNIFEMRKFLENNLDYGAVSIANPVGHDDHYNIRCVMYTRAVLEKLHFSGNQIKCCCDIVKKACEKIGLLYGYMDDKKRIKHHEN